MPARRVDVSTNYTDSTMRLRLSYLHFFSRNRIDLNTRTPPGRLAGLLDGDVQVVYPIAELNVSGRGEGASVKAIVQQSQSLSRLNSLSSLNSATGRRKHAPPGGSYDRSRMLCRRPKSRELHWNVDDDCSLALVQS